MTLAHRLSHQIAALIAFAAFFAMLSPVPVFAKGESAFQKFLKKQPVTVLPFKKEQDNKTVVNIDLGVASVFQLPVEVGRLEFTNPKHLSSGPLNNKPRHIWILGRQKGHIAAATVFDKQGRQVMVLEIRTIIKNIGFIWASYLMVGFFVGALTLWIFWAERNQIRKLDELNQNKNQVR